MTDRTRHTSRSARSRRTSTTRSSSPQGDGWESGSVYNPAAVVVDDRVALLYRAHADDIVSHVGLAWSDDGYAFEREPEPVLSPSEDYDRFGCEDPRLTVIDGTYYLTYSGWDREQRCCAWPPRATCAPGPSTGRSSRTSTPSSRRAVARPGPWSKAGGILRAPGQRPLAHVLRRGLHLGGDVEDLLHWTPTAPDTEPPVMAPRPGTFSDFLVEVGPPPLVTDDGLILLLHNAAIKNPDGSVRYTAGQLLIHPDRPNEILAELTRPWLEPTTHEDLHGLVSNVTFVEGLVWFRDRWLAYYGQSDSTLGVATFRPASAGHLRR